MDLSWFGVGFCIFLKVLLYLKPFYGPSMPFLTFHNLILFCSFMVVWGLGFLGWGLELGFWGLGFQLIGCGAFWVFLGLGLSIINMDE